MVYKRELLYLSTSTNVLNSVSQEKIKEMKRMMYSLSLPQGVGVGLAQALSLLTLKEGLSP